MQTELLNEDVRVSVAAVSLSIFLHTHGLFEVVATRLIFKHNENCQVICFPVWDVMMLHVQ